MKKKFFTPFGDSQTSAMFKRFGFEEIDSISSKVVPDFLVFTGGADVSPMLYNKAIESRTHYSVDRDFSDMTNFLAGKLKGIPMTGICRGHQLLHVANGGTLIQHIDGHALSVGHPIYNVDGSEHEYGKILVTSTHHQAVPLDETKDYDFVLKSNDDVTEAIASKKKRFFSVQFHPEYAFSAQSGCLSFYKSIFDKHFAEMI